MELQGSDCQSRRVLVQASTSTDAGNIYLGVVTDIRDSSHGDITTTDPAQPSIKP